MTAAGTPYSASARAKNIAKLLHLACADLHSVGADERRENSRNVCRNTPCARSARQHGVVDRDPAQCCLGDIGADPPGDRLGFLTPSEKLREIAAAGRRLGKRRGGEACEQQGQGKLRCHGGVVFLIRRRTHRIFVAMMRVIPGMG